MLKDRLQILLITYNRKECLQKTFEQIFAEESPIKKFDITVLNNASTDGTTELINEYCNKHSNLVHVLNRINIGASASFAKAVTEYSNKEYFWVLCDNDVYDWSCWNDVESAINNGFDVIVTQKCKNTVSELFHKASFIPACIYKASNITSTVAQNLYDYGKYIFPQLAIMAKNINEENRFFIVSKDIVLAGINDGHHQCIVRGANLEELPETRKNIFWAVGFIRSTELIKDKFVRAEIIDNLKHYHKSLFDLFKTSMIINKIYYKNYGYNFMQIFNMLNFRQKIKLIFAFLIVNLSLKNYEFYEIRSYEEWSRYFDIVNEQKYINKLARKLSGKKVVLYGAGMLAEVLLNKYNLSKLNIIGISDKRFERTGETSIFGISAIKPDELPNFDFDYVLFALKMHKSAEKSLRKLGIKKKFFTLIKKSYKYEIRN